MLNKLTFKNKKLLLVGAFILVLSIAYHFSFSKTFEAIKINRQLKNEKQETQNLDASYTQIESKHSFYTNALKLYKVNNDDRENRLWQTVSGIAVAKGVKIGFNPIQLSSTDTTALNQQTFRHEFNFKGDYFNCVLLLDSLSKTRGIGLISNLKLFTPKEHTENKTELTLQLTLATRIN